MYYSSIQLLQINWVQNTRLLLVGSRRRRSIYFSTYIYIYVSMRVVKVCVSYSLVSLRDYEFNEYALNIV